MRKKIITTIVVIMFATSILGFFVIKPAACTTTIISQNFDSETTGSAPEGWDVVDPTSCSLTVNDTVYCGSSGKSARYVDSASYPGGYAPIFSVFENQYGHLELSFAILAENPDYFSLYMDDGSLSGHGANIYLLPNMQFGYFDGSWNNFGHFSLGTWYHVKMTIDIPTNKYDIYIDNVLRVEGAHFRYFGQVGYLNEIQFGQNSWETPAAFVDDILLNAQEYKAPVATTLALSGDLDYLFQENVNVRLDALIKDINTMAPISGANATLSIYYPNGSLWISDIMLEKISGSGIYEWESGATIGQLNLDKGVYLVRAQASVGNDLPSTDILLFHIDPPPSSRTTSNVPMFYSAIVAVAILAGAILSTALLRRHRKELNTSGIKLLKAVL